MDPLLKEHTPFAQYQLVDVVFGAAHEDVVVKHKLLPPSPEHINYTVVRRSTAGIVYHDSSGTRRPWAQGSLTLRCSVEGTRATLMLWVEHDKRQLQFVTPTSVLGSAPPADHEHDAADITTGELEKARQHVATAYLDEANLFTEPQQAPEFIGDHVGDGSQLTGLDADALAAGTLPDARFPAILPAVSGQNLTALAEANITDGTILARVAADETISGDWDFTPGVFERGLTVPMGEWQSFTPVWKGSTSDPTIGNGTVEGRYMRIGKTVYFYARLNYGTTTTNGSGRVELELPTAQQDSPVHQLNGFLNFRDTAASTVNQFAWCAAGTDNTVTAFIEVNAGARIVWTVFTSNDANMVLRASGYYEED